jgi:hypothetical protein
MIESEEQAGDSPNEPDAPVAPEENTEPRENPEPDQEKIEQAEDDLDKVGN